MRVLEREEEAALCALVGAELGHVLAVEDDRAARDLVARVAHQGVRERRLARAVRPHDRVHLVRADREVDALDDLGAVVETDVKILQLEQSQVRVSFLRENKPKLRVFRDGFYRRGLAGPETECETDGGTPCPVPNVGPMELIILVVIVLLVFGSRRLPEIGRSLGGGMREFKDSVTGKDDEAARSTRTAARARTETADRHPVDVLSADWVLPISGPPIENGAVAIEAGRIAAVGTASELGLGTHYEGAAILPGFVNCHSHLEYAVYAGFGDGLHIRPVDHACMSSARRGSAGTRWSTSPASAQPSASRRVSRPLPMRASAVRRPSPAPSSACAGSSASRPSAAAPDAVLTMVDEKRERIAGSLSERVRLGVSPHAPYTVSLDAYQALAGLGLPVATHLNESPAELEWLLHGTGPMELFRELLVAPAGTTGIRLLAEHGLLGPNVVAAHCVVVDEEEIGLLAAHRVGVAHCPRSNGVLGCGIAPVEKLLDAGITVGIGTDSPASTPSFDMFDEMRAAVLYARLRTQRPDTMPAAKALELATLGSARALGLDDRIGSLEPGKLADVAVVGLEGSPFLPWEDPAAAVVLRRSPRRGY